MVQILVRGWKTNTQEKIAEDFKVTHKTVSNILGKISKNGEITKDFTPLLYNIWNTQKGNETDHFGSFPIVPLIV